MIIGINNKPNGVGMSRSPSNSVGQIWPDVDDPFLRVHLPGVSASVRQLRNAIAPLNMETNRDLVRVVSITGESGAGKNHLARVLAAHRFWLREEAGRSAEIKSRLDLYTERLVEIPLPTLPDQLVESELFGHKKGAFTGADRERQGLLAESVDDILLDEIGDASPTVQAKLLGVVETRRFRKVGAGIDEEEETAARFLLATHRDMRERVKSGEFREDLYWRAMEFQLRVPPLREQPENIPLLVQYQLSGLMPLGMFSSSPNEGLREPPIPSVHDLEWATGYHWPGNLRQLRHSLVRWLVAEGRVSLQAIAVQAESEMSPHMGSAVRSEVDQGEAWSRLEKGIANGTAVAPRLTDLVDEMREKAVNEILAWYHHRRPSTKDMTVLFPGMKANSIVSKMSQWRNR